MRRTTYFLRRNFFNEIFIFLMLLLFIIGGILALFSPLGNLPIIKNSSSVFFIKHSSFLGAFLDLFIFKVKIILISALVSLTIFGAAAIPALVCAYGVISASAAVLAIQNNYRILSVSIINALDALLFIPFFLILSTYLISLSLDYAGLSNNPASANQYKFTIPINILKLILLLLAIAVAVSLIQAPLLII